MDLKQLVTKYAYRIEPKPEGGFIARATDPTVAPLEAATREELLREIQSTVLAGLTSDFPGLQLPSQGNELKFAFHFERKPGGGFTIESSDLHTVPTEAASHEEVESHFAEKLIGFVGKHLAPEFSQALAAQGGSGDIKVFVKKTGFSVTAGSSKSASSTPIEGGTISNASLSNAGPIDASPITPGRDRSGGIFRFLLALVIVAALMYFFLQHR